MSRTRMVVIDGPESIPALDHDGVDEWRILLTADGTPCGFVALPSPGPGSSRALARALLTPHLDAHRDDRRLRAELRRRLGVTEPSHPRPTCSVVVCTRRRRGLLSGVLDSARRLDPAPDELIVVDNDPGDDDCRAEAERAGARYVREDRSGLNNARRAGLRAARSEVAAFTDDDCLLQPGWLRSLPAHFADPMVAAVTGPAFPHRLDTEAQVARERAAPYLQNLSARTFDWTTVPPVRTGGVGFGASMVLRCSAVAEIGAVFPPELDAGTRTRSGGDLYALYRILAAGYRVSYDPGAFVFHRHGESGEPPEWTVRSWATGFTAFLTRALVVDRELGAIAYSTLSLRELLRATLEAAQGIADPAAVRMRWLHLTAALGGPAAWTRAVIESRGAAAPGQAGRKPLPSPEPPRRARPGRRSGRAKTAPAALSVILATAAPPQVALARLEALASRQTIDKPWEAVVVSSAGPSAGSEGSVAEVAEGVPVRWVRGPGGWPGSFNAAVAAASGAVLLFLDEELAWLPELLATHLARHASARDEVAVLGYSPIRPPGRSLAALASRLRSEDHFRLTREATRRTFLEVEASNLSISRGALERVGPFASDLPPARAGWEWGLRALRAGVEVVYEPGAAAFRERSVSAAGYVGEALVEGRADAMLLGRYPELDPHLPRPPVAGTLIARLAEASLTAALGAAGTRRAAIGLLHLLEAARLRRAWLWIATAARRGAYRQGFRSVPGGAVRRSRGDQSVQVVELDSSHPVRPPELAAPSFVDLQLGGKRLARVRPRGGHWHHAAFEAALDEDDSARRAVRALRRSDDIASRLDLADAAVIFGPRRGREDAAHRRAFEAAGAAVIITDAAPRRLRIGWRDHWAELDRALRAAAAEVVGVPLPGVRPEPAWLAEVGVGLDGGRIAAVIGAGVARGRAPAPLRLLAPERGRLPYQADGRAPQFIVVRGDLYEELGGFDPAAAVAGAMGPLLDFVERAVDAGFVIGYRETLGVTPAEGWSPLPSGGRWRRAQARGGLLARRAIAIGGIRGAAWFASRALLPRAIDLGRALTTRDHGLRGWAVASVGFLVGCSRVAISPRSRRAR